MVRKSPKTRHGMSCYWARAHLPVIGNAVKAGDEVKFLMSKNYSWKICYLEIILINIYKL